MMQRGQSIEKLQGIQENKEMFLPINFQQEFVKTLSAYFLLKDALVTDDAANASLFAEQMLKELQSVNTSGLQHIELQHFYVIIKALEEIIKNNDLIHQRNSFVKLNKHLSVLSRNFEKLSNTLYIQQCPMADNNKGAVWLSKEKEIKNPYFGKKMLTCGSVIDTL